MSQLHKTIKDRNDCIWGASIFWIMTLVSASEGYLWLTGSFGLFSIWATWLACRDQRKINRICAGMLDRALNGGKA